MLGFLFRGLTPDVSAGGALFERLTQEARQPSWFTDGCIPDTIDGRFAVLATIVALALVRLEDEGDEGNRLSVALTEQFIAVMDSEHREMGISDPTLGKTVRKLVTMLARRTDSWRTAVSGEVDWIEATRGSMLNGAVAADPLNHNATALKTVFARLAAESIDNLRQGKIG